MIPLASWAEFGGWAAAPPSSPSSVAADARSFAFHVSCIFGRRRNIFVHPGLEVGSLPLYFHRSEKPLRSPTRSTPCILSCCFCTCTPHCCNCRCRQTDRAPIPMHIQTRNPNLNCAAEWFLPLIRILALSSLCVPLCLSRAHAAVQWGLRLARQSAPSETF